MCWFSTGVSAQGNLQFNSVKWYPLTVTQSGVTYAESITNITVPANKVWKIESAACNVHFSTNNYSSITAGGRIMVDNRVVFEAYTTGGSMWTSQTFLPIWLPAGNYTISIKSSTNSGSNTYNGYLSAIEFNIVP